MGNITLVLRPSANLAHAVWLCDKLTKLADAEVEQVVRFDEGTAIKVSVPNDTVSLVDWLRSLPEVAEACEDRMPSSDQLCATGTPGWLEHTQFGFHRVIRVALRHF